jgi:hypothetical protein
MFFDSEKLRVVEKKQGLDDKLGGIAYNEIEFETLTQMVKEGKFAALKFDEVSAKRFDDLGHRDLYKLEWCTFHNSLSFTDGDNHFHLIEAALVEIKPQIYLEGGAAGVEKYKKEKTEKLHQSLKQMLEDVQASHTAGGCSKFNEGDLLRVRKEHKALRVPETNTVVVFMGYLQNPIPVHEVMGGNINNGDIFDCRIGMIEPNTNDDSGRIITLYASWRLEHIE